jgi:hypothetical protein
MSTQAFAPPIQAELPDWILALKPPEADLAAPMESAVFVGLDSELEELVQASPEDLAWLAETAEQTTKLLSVEQAGAILDGKAKPMPALKRRKRRARKMRPSQLLALDLMLVMMIAALLLLALILRFLIAAVY